MFPMDTNDFDAPLSSIEQSGLEAVVRSDNLLCAGLQARLMLWECVTGSSHVDLRPSHSFLRDCR